MQAAENIVMSSEDAPSTALESWQLITGDKVFRDVQAYLQEAEMMSKGLGYHVIAVFGSQSTGKSTLLNMLFGTTFATMDTANRKQTTKGIWLSKAADADILVMDVEGTDGRERGDDQDFERKSALFSIVTTEILVVNMWESQVGLYNGANMGLLKTVFEVNLQLFQTCEDKPRKTLLLFVIRDYLGTTPITNLASSVERDLERIWNSLNKPSYHSESRVAQFFDIEFIGLPHKILQPDIFNQRVLELRQKFIKDGQIGSFFHPEYHKRIPIDGFSIYAKGVWETIEANKDLDLPTQQQMLAQYRCDELAAEAHAVFENSFLPLEAVLYAEGTDNLLGPRMTAVYTQSMEVFDIDASRYDAQVYAKKRQDLSSLLDNRLSVLYRHQLQGLRRAEINTFESLVREEITLDKHADFESITSRVKLSCTMNFTARAEASCVELLPWSHTSDLENLLLEISTVKEKLQVEERQRITTEMSSVLRAQVSEAVRQEFVRFDVSVYDRIASACFGSLIPIATRNLEKRLVNLNVEQSQIDLLKTSVCEEGVTALEPAILLETDDTRLLLRLRDHFEEHFRFDKQGIPRVWQSGDNMDGHYKQAKDSALALLSKLSILPLEELEAYATRDLGVLPAMQERPNIQILALSRESDLASRLIAITSSAYIDAKRSTVSSVANIPLFFYGLLLVLGWNELVALLRNPIYFIALAVIGLLAYLIYHLNLTASVEQLARTMSSTLLDIIKDKLRAALNVESSNIAVPAESQSASIKTIESKKAQ